MEGYSQKRILILGGSGFIGRNLIDKLSKYNVELTVINKNSNVVFNQKNLRFEKFDLTDKKVINLIFRNQDLVFLCAANTSGAQVINKYPLTHLFPNIAINNIVAEALSKWPIEHLVFISSSVVYPDSNKSMRESDIDWTFFEKYEVAGMMKLFSERIFQFTQKYGLLSKLTILRPSNLFGPHDKFDSFRSKVIPALIKQYVDKSNTIKILGDGKEYRDFLYIEDFIDAMLLAVENTQTVEIFNVASGFTTQINVVSSIIQKLTGHKPSDYLFDTNFKTMIPERNIDILKLQSLGWAPSFNFEQGLLKTILWYEENRELLKSK